MLFKMMLIFQQLFLTGVGTRLPEASTFSARSGLTSKGPSWSGLKIGGLGRAAPWFLSDLVKN